MVALNQVKGNPVGNQAVIAAGTGLGEAGMYWDGTPHQVFACEGGHADFAPRNDLEVELFRYLHTRFGHVSYERILSGPGLVNVFHFLRDTGRGTEPQWLIDEMLQSDPAAAISQAALKARAPCANRPLTCSFPSMGRKPAIWRSRQSHRRSFPGRRHRAQNSAQAVRPAVHAGFCSKGRMQALLESIPVRVAINDKTALLGAARCAAMKSAA